MHHFEARTAIAPTPRARTPETTRRLLHLLFALLATGAGLGPPVSTAAHACIDPATYGALPNDGQDDRPGVQAAIDAHRTDATICFQEGTYDFTRGATLRSLNLAGARNLRLTGQGPGTILRMNGNGNLGDWYLIHVIDCSNVQIDSMTLDGTLATNTDEQTHLIELGVGASAVENILLTNLWFNFPHPAAPLRAGDCIRLVGEVSKPTRRVVISNSVFGECARSSIALQRASYDVVISGNQFLEVSDQHIDMEPSGTGGIERFTISGNVFNGGAQGAWHVALAGNNPEPGIDFTFTGNVLHGRGIGLYNVERSVIRGNVIDAQVQSAEAVVSIIKQSERIVFEGNTVTRLAGSLPGAVIKVRHHNSGNPGEMVFADNDLRQEVDGHILDMESVQDVTVAGNALRFGGPTANTFAAVMERATVRDLERFSVTGNRIFGPLAQAVRIAASPNDVGAVLVTGNIADGPARGLVCEGSGDFTVPVVHTGNLYQGATSEAVCPTAVLATHAP